MTQEESIMLLVGIAVIASLPYMIAASRTSESVTVGTSDKVSNVPTKLAPAEAFKVITAFARSGGYSIASISEPTLCLCLEESASWKSYGFFIPINILATPEGGSVVEIGIKEKLQLPQFMRPLQQVGQLGRSHEKCVSGVRAAFVVAV